MIKDIKLEGIGQFLPRHPADTAKKKDSLIVEKSDVAVELSSAHLASLEAGATDRVAAAKMAIESGEYRVDKDKLATNIYHQIFGGTAGNDNT